MLGSSWLSAKTAPPFFAVNGTAGRGGVAMSTIKEFNLRMLKPIRDFFRKQFPDSLTHPLFLGADGYALSIRANHNDLIDHKYTAHRPAGYIDVAIRPLRRTRVVLRVWTEDRGSGLNNQLKKLHFADSVVETRPGLSWEDSLNKTEDLDAPRGIYDFYRDISFPDGVLSAEQMKTLLEDYRAIESKLGELNLL